MRVVSLNVGRPRDVAWKGRTVSTGIFKEPVSGRVAVRGHQIDGDGQADPSVHGGPDKAVYAYPSEHYPFWVQELPDVPLPFGAFGENLTTGGIAEADVHIGDRIRVGTAELRITQPRSPCFKLGIRLGRADAVKRFQAAGRSGFYLSVVREGYLAAGDAIEVVEVDPRRLSVASVNALHAARRADRNLLHDAANHPHLARSWRDEFARRLARDEA